MTDPTIEPPSASELCGPSRLLGSTPEPRSRLTPELITALEAIEPCNHCRGRHARYCPRVAEVEFHENGKLKRAKFWPDGKWSDAHILWPDEPADTTPEAIP